MAITRRSRRHGDDDGLSEVIGFVIIFGIIVILFANYMLYGIPAQGRDSEIAHMNEIRDQFVDYKVGLDSLFINNKNSTTISNSFTLGTGGSFSMGANSIIPIMSPVRSSGTIGINRRGQENLTISSRSLIQNSTRFTVVDFSSQTRQINYTPSHVYVNVSGIQSSDLAKDKIFGATINGTNWVAIVNLTPQNAFYLNWIMPSNTTACTPQQLQDGAIDVRGPSSERGCFIPTFEINFTGTDLQISISKSNVSTMEKFPVYRTIKAGTIYTIDLMDDAYGLGSYIQPSGNITLAVNKPLGSINATGNITYGFTEINPYTITPISLGALEYQAQNNYWISQNYYYQLGGIFVTQNDGNSTYKLPPEISFSNDAAKNIVTVNINALVFDTANQGIVGGNSPVQVRTTMTGNTRMPFVEGSANTMWIRIGVNTTDSHALAMWKNYFNYTAMAAGIPNTMSGNTTTESYIFINGSDKMGATYDINVIASNATFSTVIHGIGGTYT